MKISALPILLVLSFLLSLVFATTLPDPLDPKIDPIYKTLNPDESDHIAYISKLYQQKGFVRFTTDPETGHAAKGFSETHQPPLYYLLCVVPYAVSSHNLIAVRLVSSLIALLTIAVFYKSGRDLFPERGEVGPGMAAFAAFLPATAQLSGAVNNDALTTLIASLLFWRLGVLVTRGQTIKDATILGALIGMGLLTKLTILQLLPTVCLTHFIGRTRLESNTAALKQLAIALGIGFLVASPWLTRNTLLYGDPFTLKIFPMTAPIGTPTPESMQRLMHWSPTDYGLQDALRSFTTFFVILPPNVLQAVTWLNPVLALFSLTGLLGALRLAQQEPARRSLVLVMLLGVGLLIPFFIRFNLQFFQAQGRYFHPALLPVALIFTVGIGQFFSPTWRPRIIALIALLFFFGAMLQALKIGYAFVTPL
jgi:4-amino-4-deoxy-L-arabinose transferase-like glycosyltransferase